MAAAAILDFCSVWILTVNLSAGPHFHSACVSNSVQMRAIVAELWPRMWFSIWRPPPCWIVLDSSSEVRNVHGSYSRCLYQIWCKSVHKWRSYGRLTDLKMAAAAILNLLPVSIFIIWSSLDSGWGCSCKISYVYVNIYGWLIKLCQKIQNGGRRRHLELLFGNPRSLLHGPNIVLKFHFNRFVSIRDMAVWKFCKFGLNIPAPKICVFGDFDP